MKLQLPPILFYAVGAVLVVFGALRAYHLGWKVRRAEAERASAPLEEGEEADREERRGRGAAYTAKRHLMWGLVWIGMGLFLLISTRMNS